MPAIVCEEGATTYEVTDELEVGELAYNKYAEEKKRKAKEYHAAEVLHWLRAVKERGLPILAVPVECIQDVAGILFHEEMTQEKIAIETTDNRTRRLTGVGRDH